MSRWLEEQQRCAWENEGSQPFEAVEALWVRQWHHQSCILCLTSSAPRSFPPAGCCTKHQPRQGCDARSPQTYKVENILNGFSSCEAFWGARKTCCNKPSLDVQSWEKWHTVQYFCYKSSVPREWNATVINHCRMELGKKEFQKRTHYFSFSKTENIPRVSETLGRLLQSPEIISFSMLIKIDLTAAKTGVPWDFVAMEFHQIKMLRPN